MIIKLSNLMTNILSGKKLVKIMLQKEIDLIRSYVDIHQMSFTTEHQVDFLATGNFKGIDIPPFLFFQLVEEGFLVLNDFSENSDLTILIKAEPNYLLFSISIWNDKAFNRPFNIGVIDNCRKFLNYFYPENHKVVSNIEINFVEVVIEIYI
jgi:LytS/YehU family sensor histidine kinase